MLENQNETVKELYKLVFDDPWPYSTKPSSWTLDSQNDILYFESIVEPIMRHRHQFASRMVRSYLL